MRLFIVLIAATLFLKVFTACNSAAPPATFCDTACLKDTLKFTESGHPLQPYLYISPGECGPGQVILSHGAMDVDRKMGFEDLLGGAKGVRIAKSHLSAFIKDTSYVWLTFNDCNNGRGYIIRIPFNKTDKIRRKGSAITGFDPKFSVAPGLVAYTDKGNLFIEDMVTSKTAMMTFGKELDFDFDAIHETIDSVNITPTRIWARFKDGENWKEKSENVELKEP